MKYNYAVTSLILFPIILLAGCRKDHSTSEKQLVLFQYDYSYSPGQEHNGFFIDNKGNIMTFSNPEKWNYQEKLTEEQVIANMNSCKLSNIKVPQEELQKYRNYIANIASSKITAKKAASSNMGTARFICYQYSENAGNYVGHVIKMEGDSTCENLNFYSKKVTSWMRETGNQIGNDVIRDLSRQGRSF